MECLIGIHGFTSVEEADKSAEVVLRDRVEAAVRFIEVFNPSKTIVYVNVLAEQKKYVSDLLNILQQKTELHFVEENVEDTESEIEYLIRKANMHNVDLLVSTSSIDHTPRIEQLHNRKTISEPFESIVFSGKDYYTKNKVDPFILEGRFEEFIEPLNKIFSIDKSNREKAAKKIQQFLD